MHFIRFINNIRKWLLKLALYACLIPIRAYQLFISPFLPAQCRYYPTCSEYAQTAFKRYGVLRGMWLTIKRLSRCHPWGRSGIDPVPEKYAPAWPISHRCIQRAKAKQLKRENI